MYQVFNEYLQSLPEPAVATLKSEGMELRVKFTEWAVLYASVCDDIEQMQYELDGDAYTKKRAKDIKSDETWKRTKALVKTSIINRSEQARKVNAAHEILERNKYEEYLAKEAKRKSADTALALDTADPLGISHQRFPDERPVSPARVGSGTMSIGSSFE